MNNEQKLILFFVVGMLGLSAHHVIMHENVHQIIFEHYDIESEISYGMEGGSCTAVIPSNMSIDDYREMNILHTWNELTGYNMITLCLSILFGSFVIAMAIMLRGGE